MADSFVKVTESTDPAAKQIDNESVDYGGTTRYRQRTAVPDGANVEAGTTTDAAITTDAGGTSSGKLRGLVKWAFERMPSSLGQKTKANSFPVVLASDQDAVSVSEQAVVTEGAVLPPLLKIAAGYDSYAALVHALPLQRVNGDIRMLVSDSRNNSALGGILLVLEEIRDLLMEAN